MSSFEDLSFSPHDFSGVVRLFPLPNLVLFPHVMQPLHIFEPRYRCLMEDALAGDRLIAMAVLTPGWERDYEGRPPICRTACLGRITTYHRLDDGTYNLLLLGVKRVELLRELEPHRPFREAEAQLCEDVYPSGDKPTDHSLMRRLREAFLHILPSVAEAREQIDQIMASDIPLGVLTDVISFLIDLDVRRKESLLCERDVCRRADLLLEHLESAAGRRTGFPPRFSVN